MDEVPESALEKAAREGHVNTLHAVVKGSEFDGSSEEAASALCAAAGHSNWDAVRFLVQDAGVDCSPDDSGGTVLQLAAVSGRLDIMEILLAAGANMKSAQVGPRVLLSSSATGQLAILRYAIKQGADVTAYGGPAAWSAAKASCWECVRELISSDVDLATEGIGVRLLSLAAVRGQADLVELLKQSGVMIKGEAGELALSSLASTQEWDICADAVRYLLANGVSTHSGAGTKALVTASIYGDLEMVELLADSGVDLKSTSVGEALTRAGELGAPASTERIVKYLTDKGAVLPKSPELVLDEDF